MNDRGSEVENLLQAKSEAWQECWIENPARAAIQALFFYKIKKTLL
jgi:hypothetical protein